MQITKTIFQNSAIFIKKKWAENQLWENVDFCGEKELTHLAGPAACLLQQQELVTMYQGKVTQKKGFQSN